MTADYADFGALQALQNFITDLNLATNSLQATAAQISAAIAAAGTPLLHGWKELVSASVALPAATVTTLNPVTFTKPGYMVSFWAAYSGASGGEPFVRIRLVWVDTGTGNNLAEEHWTIPVTATGGFLPVYGKGPTKGATLHMTATNADTVDAMTLFYEVSETTQHIARDDWRCNAVSNVPGNTGPPECDPFAGILGQGTTVVPANSTTSYLLPLYSGESYLYTAVSGNCTIDIEAVNPTGGTTGVIFSVTLTATQEPPQLIPLPRCPCLIQFKNPAVTASLNVVWSLGLLEYAS